MTEGFRRPQEKTYTESVVRVNVHAKRAVFDNLRHSVYNERATKDPTGTKEYSLRFAWFGTVKSVHENSRPRGKKTTNKQLH